MKELIKIVNVWKVYQLGKVKVEAVRGISLTIEKGEFISIMGASGSGKSTLMNLIGCLDIPTKGKIYLNGKDIAKLDESSLAAIRGKTIGFVFQQFNLIPTLSAIENVILPMTFQGIPRDKRVKRAVELLNLVGLGKRLSHYPNELSGGQQQRVAIARALANEPDLILADEPTGNVDSKAGSIILDYLKKLNKEENKTIVMVTHDPHVAKLGERLIRIGDGRIIGGNEK